MASIYADFRPIGAFSITGGAYPTPGDPGGICTFFIKQYTYHVYKVDNFTYRVYKRINRRFVKY